MIAVDHRLAFSNPALLSAPSKKSFSSVSSPILACSAFTSTGGSCAMPVPLSKTSGAPPSSCAFHVVTWFGWLSHLLRPKLRRPLQASRDVRRPDFKRCQGGGPPGPAADDVGV